ncbi:TetR/AcrR family transcriptional regulator [Microbacteriaceae bacterium VKM Ac-2854]|nr:TetR/AcrR family transcriptional regulator [Microbacteriaceae bacterium VKM Ac-2854]
MAARTPLSRERIIDAAVRVADGGGLVAVSMRNVGRELGVEAMSLYNHVANKEDLLDGLANRVFELFGPVSAGPWRASMTARARTAREVLSAHPWGLGLIESRRAGGLAILRYHDAVLGCLRADGFSVPLAAHAFSALDAYVYGFVLTEVNLPFSSGEGADEMAAELALPAQEYPHMVEMMQAMVIGHGYEYGSEFEYGLELILDALEVKRASSADVG